MEKKSSRDASTKQKLESWMDEIKHDGSNEACEKFDKEILKDILKKLDALKSDLDSTDWMFRKGK
jgi:hypothetical protein